jgi:hypothetical protein
MGAAVGAAFVVALTVCLLSIGEKLKFWVPWILMRCTEGDLFWTPL